MWCNFYSHVCNYHLTSLLWKSLPFTMFEKFEGIKFQGFYFFSHWISKQNTYKLFRISSKLISCAPFTTFNPRRHLSKALAWELDIYLSNLGLQIQTPNQQKALVSSPWLFALLDQAHCMWISSTKTTSSLFALLDQAQSKWISSAKTQVPAQVSIVPELKAALHISYLFLFSSSRHHTAA
jgi:hypothetical protein